MDFNLLLPFFEQFCRRNEKHWPAVAAASQAEPMEESQYFEDLTQTHVVCEQYARHPREEACLQPTSPVSLVWIENRLHPRKIFATVGGEHSVRVSEFGEEFE